MDQKQLSQLDPKLKAVYDRVMGIATASAPTLPQATPQFHQPPAPPTIQQTGFGAQQSTIPALPQTPSTSPRPSFVVEEVAHPNPVQTPPPPVQPTPPAFTPITTTTPSHSDQGQTFFAQDTQAIPTLRSQQPAPPMQPMQSAMPVTSYAPQQAAVVPAKNSHAFMVLFIILGIIFFILYGVFWVQLFNIGIPALTSS